MLAGEFNRFDVFSGEIKDNKGKVVVPAGEKMVQADLDQFPPGAPGLECKYCMYWWADGITAELPKLVSQTFRKWSRGLEALQVSAHPLIMKGPIVPDTNRNDQATMSAPTLSRCGASSNASPAYWRMTM